MVINTNIAADQAARYLSDSTSALAKSLARLSSGSKIVNPSDDAAGLAVSMRLDAQVGRTQAAYDGVGSAISFSQTQDGYLAKVAKALDRMSQLAIKAKDVTVSDDDRALYQKEFSELKGYISDIASKDFNGVSLFSGSSLSVVVNSEGTNSFSMTENALSGTSTGGAKYATVVASGETIATTGGADTALADVKAAITQLASDRAQVGANMTRLTYTQDQLAVLKQNLQSASSRIKDVDVAEEATNYAKQNILVQAGTAMVAQANAMPQSVLTLLR